jgi:hypothetical protein
MNNQNPQNIEKININENVDNISEYSNYEKIQEITQQKFEEWRNIGKYLNQEKQNEIEEIIFSISELLIELENESISDEKLEEFIISFANIENGLENSLIENKTEIVNENRNFYNSKIENFEKELENEKEEISNSLIQKLPKETLAIKIEDQTVEEIVKKEISLALNNIASEVYRIPTLLDEIENNSDPKIIIKKMEELFKFKSILENDMSSFIESLYTWNEKAEVSSKTMSDLNEYIISLDFFFSKKSIEDKLGIEVPNTSNFNNTRKLIEDRQEVLLDRFSRDAKFIKKYKRLSIKEISLLKSDWENDIICQFIADTFEKDNIKFKREDKYEVDIIKMFTNYHSRKNYKSWEKLYGNRGRSADDAYLEHQRQFFQEIINHPELKFIRIHIFAESSGDKNSAKIDRSFYSISQKLIEMNYLNDPRLIEYKDLIIEIAEIGELQKTSSKEAESRRIELLKKHGEDIRSPEGLANLLYGYRRMFLTFGDDTEKLMELSEKGILTYQMVNNTEKRKGDKYKEGRAFLMTQKTFENRQEINAGKSALITEEKSEKLSSFQQTETDLGHNRIEIQEDSKGLKYLIDKSKEAVKGIIKKTKNIFKKSKEGNTKDLVYEILKLFYDDADVENLKLSQEEIIEKVPEDKELNQRFLINLEKKGRFDKKTLDKISQKELLPEAINYLMERKYYSNSLIQRLTSEKDFYPKNINNINYFKKLNLPKTTNEIPNIETAIDGKDVPIIKNPKALLYLAENFTEINNPEMTLVLKVFLLESLKTSKSEIQNEIFIKAFESIYKELMNNPSDSGINIYLEYLMLTKKKNIQDFTENDLEMIELISEKNPIYAKKYLENWVEKYGDTETVKPFDFENEEEREKIIKIITTLEKINSPLFDYLRNSIVKKANLEMGFEENYSENSMELAKIALNKNGEENPNKQLKAIKAFKEGIYKYYNPFEEEYSQTEFQKKLDQAEQEAKSKTLT